MANPFRETENKAKAKPKPSEPTTAPAVEQGGEGVKNPLAGKLNAKAEGKSYGFYLSSEAIEKLEALAKQNKCSKSKALDALLRNML